MLEISEVSSAAAKWLQQFPPSRWALVYFEGTRYGHLSSNIDEFNRWILEARELPIIQKRMIEAINHASAYQVLRSDEVEFEVLSAERSDIVNIGTHSCSCRGWQLYGIPCSHAVAALVSCRKDVYTFTEKCFTVAGYREAYAETIHPIPERIEWRKMSEAPMDDDDDDECSKLSGHPSFVGHQDARKRNEYA
ncbi:uncharacterized protein [Populus alba]|uniref:uncharacterized protein n=1 Tax=Populus alba TaxID=43335 RepID=UPI003CC73586